MVDFGPSLLDPPGAPPMGPPGGAPPAPPPPPEPTKKDSDILLKMRDTGIDRRKSFLDMYEELEYFSYNKDYDEKRMLRKIKHKAAGLKEFARTDDFIKSIQDIYNWMEPLDNKVSFVKL